MRIILSKTERDKFELGKLMAKVYNRLDDKTDIAMGLKHDYRKKSDKITLGVRYKQSETFTIKGKVFNQYSCLKYRLIANLT
jgi:hypothetical protein